MKSYSNGRLLKLALVILLISSGLAALVYNMPFGDSASAYDVSLTAGNASKEVAAGQQVSYLLTITNEGNNGDRYSITSNISKDPSTWTVQLSQTSTSNVGSGTTTTFTVTVRAPSTGVTISSYCYATIKVTSQNDPTNSTASVLLSTVLKRNYGVSITSPGIKNLDPGTSTTYNFQVKNEGNDRDGYSLEAVTIPSGWSASVDFDTGKFDSGDTKNATLTVQAPSDALSQSYQFVVKASSVTDNTTFATRTITANVNQKHRVSIRSEGVKQVDIINDRVVNFNVEITNLGNGEDQYNLEYYVPPQYVSNGWGGDLSTTTTSKLDADDSTNITLYAYIPSKSFNPAVNSKGEFYINATSVGNNSVERQVKVSCVVKPYYDVSVLNTGPSSKTVDPDGSVVYTFRVTNKGNDEDDIDLTLTYPTGFEDSSVEPSSLSLAAGASTNVNVTLNPDSDVVKSQSYRMRLAANSSNGPGAHSDFFVVINKHYGAFLDAPNGAIISSGQPGNEYSIPVRLQNKGNGKDSFDLSVQGETPSMDVEWAPLVSAATTPLMDSDQYYYFNLTVSAPSNATQGTYRFKVNASSSNSDVYKTIWLSVRIPQLYNVDISANKQSVKGQFSNASGTPRSVTFDLDVYNRGSGEDDSISIEVKSAPSAFAGLYSVYFENNDRSLISIDSGLAESANLDIEMPKIGSGLTAGTYFFIVEATTDNGTLTDDSDDKTAEINLSLVLEPVHRVKILSGINSSSVNIGSSITYSVIIQNRGTSSDYYQLSLEHPNYGSNIVWSIPNTNLTTNVLKPLEQETITLTATIKSGADPDLGSVWVKVTATHSTDLTIFDAKYFTAVFSDKFAGNLATNDNYESTEPGSSVSYNLSIENWGTRSSDTFSLEIEEQPKDDEENNIFENIVISPSTITLVPNEKKYIDVTITVPSIDETIIETGTYDLVFKATSDGETTQPTDDVKIDNLTLKVKILPVKKIQFLIPAGSAEVEVGETISNVELNVTNKGNEPATMTVKVDSQTPAKYRSWVTISPSTLSNLDPNEAGSVYANIKAPSNAIAETFSIYFNVSTTDGLAFKVEMFDVTVKEDYDIDVYVSGGRIKEELEPGEETSFEVKMKNIGNTADSFELSLQATKTWVTDWGIGAAFEQEALDLPINAIRTINVNIKVDENAQAGPQTFTVKATSLNDDSISDSQLLTVEVEPNRAVELTSSEQSKDIVPDVDQEFTEVEYEVQVLNKGEASDTFKLQVLDNTVTRPDQYSREDWENLTSDHNFKVVLSKTVTNTISKNGQETITVTVQVPNTFYQPATHRTSIWAYSEGDTAEDNKYSDILFLQTKVKQAYGANILGEDYVKTKEGTSAISTNEQVLYAQFTSRVENTGTGTDDFKIEVETLELPAEFDILFSIDQGQSFSSSEPQITGIDEGDETSVIIRVEAPVDILTGRYTFNIRWISRGDDREWNAEKDYVTSWKEMTIEVDQVYGVTVEVDQENLDVNVGDAVQFKVTVQNQGNDDDTFRIEVTEMDDTDNWYSISKTKFTLDAAGKTTNDRTDITLTIRVPNDNDEAIAGNYRFNVTIKRDSTNRFEWEKATDYITVSVEVQEAFEHELESDDDSKDGDLGERVSYRFKVTNKGNSRDTYKIEVKGDKSDWASLSAEEVTLDPEEDTYVYLYVQIPVLEDDGLNPYVDDPEEVEAKRYDFEVEVTSQGQDDANPIIQPFTVNVQQEFKVFIQELSEATATDPYEYDVNDKTEDLKLTFTIENQGNKQDTFKIRKPSRVPVGWSVSVSPPQPTIDIGEQQEITVTITFERTSGFEGGIHDLKFEIQPDTGSVSARTAREDVTLYVKALVPDLLLEDVDIPSNSDLATDKKVTITAWVRNIGTAQAEDVTVNMVINGVSTPSESKTIDAGGSYNFTFDWTPTDTGTYEFEFEVDQALKELDDRNNDFEDQERKISPFNPENYISFTALLLIILALIVLAILIIAGLLYNRNKEIRELEGLVERLKTDRSSDRGGPRKVIKEAAGAPTAPKAAAGLPSAPGALAPASGAKKEAPKKGETVKVACPQCKTQQVVTVDKRPAEIPCKECGVTLLIPEKK